MVELHLAHCGPLLCGPSLTIHSEFTGSEYFGGISVKHDFSCIAVQTSREPGWLEGTLNGKRGLIPQNYVKLL